MPRGPRIDAPGVIHHVTIRGVARQLIFRDDLDRSDFVSRLARIVREEDARCYAYALLGNHVHAVLRSGPKGISRVMARIATGYAIGFNTRHGRVGHLLQNRFHSRIVDTDEYARTVVRYVHRNPLEAKIVPGLRSLRTYPWCGHRDLVRPQSRPLLDRDEVLSWFDSDPRAAVRLLEEWMAAEESDVGPDSCSEDFEALIRWACRVSSFGEPQSLLSSRSRTASTARALIAHVARDSLGMTYSRIGQLLRVSHEAARKASERGRALRVQLDVKDWP